MDDHKCLSFLLPWCHVHLGSDCPIWTSTRLVWGVWLGLQKWWSGPAKGLLGWRPRGILRKTKASRVILRENSQVMVFSSMTMTQLLEVFCVVHVLDQQQLDLTNDLGLRRVEKWQWETFPVTHAESGAWYEVGEDLLSMAAERHQGRVTLVQTWPGRSALVAATAQGGGWRQCGLHRGMALA